jgi:hypothetical protein
MVTYGKLEQRLHILLISACIDVGGQLEAPAAFAMRITALYSLDRKLSGLQIWFRDYDEEKMSCLCRESSNIYKRSHHFPFVLLTQFWPALSIMRDS